MSELSKGYDVVVVGGGAAGLAGALTLARSRRAVVVVDAGAPRNARATGVHGLLALEGLTPDELLERGRAEVRGYGGQVVDGEVARVIRDGEEFVVSLTNGRTTTARRLLVTTGLTDELPAVAGLAERWGRDVVHCPYCHGWEVRDRAIGVLARSSMSVHQALMWRQWSSDVIFFAGPSADLDVEQAEQLAARDVPMIDAEVAGLEVVDDQLAGVRLADGTVIPRSAVSVMPRMRARAEFLAALGVPVVPHPAGVGDHVEVDPTGCTAVPGIWAAGNVTDVVAQVADAAAAGTAAARQINADLVQEETRQAVLARRNAASQPRPAVLERS